MQKLWINIGIYTTTLLWTVVSTLFSPLAFLIVKVVKQCPTAQAVRELVWIYGRVWVWCTSLFVPIDILREPPPTPCILVMNHASFFDTYLLGAQPLKNVCMTIRDWPYKIPFYRPFMEGAKYVRTESAKPGQIIEEAVRELKAGHTITFFPEGTRTHDGKLGRFRSGAFYAAIEADVPIVPMCISGMFRFLPRGAKTLSYSPIRIKQLPPIYPAHYKDLENGHIQMRKDVKQQMADTLEALTRDQHN